MKRRTKIKQLENEKIAKTVNTRLKYRALKAQRRKANYSGSIDLFSSSEDESVIYARQQ